MSELSAHPPACPDPERLEAYARQALPPAEAGAVEEHFLGCDACWRQVRQALEIRAAFEGDAAAPKVGRNSGAGTRSRGWPRAALAAAAVLTVVLGGAWLWQVAGPGRQAPPLRGGAERPLLEISVERSDDGLDVRWQRVPGAHIYRVELAGDEGVPVPARETEGLALHLDPGHPSVSRVRVLALDELRQELAASPWTVIGAGGSGRGGPGS